MTNMEIIAIAKMANNIPVEVEVDTIKGWNRKGKKVKMGEHAAFKTKIWHPKKRKLDDDEEVEETSGRFNLWNASFFTEAQVE